MYEETQRLVLRMYSHRYCNSKLIFNITYIHAWPLKTVRKLYVILRHHVLITIKAMLSTFLS
jgi:hypothetical protein